MTQKTPSAVKAAAGITSGSVRVIGPSGEFRLMADGKEQHEKVSDDSDKFEKHAEEIATINAQIIAMTGLVASTVEHVNALVVSMNDAVKLLNETINRHDEITNGMAVLATVMERPVVPVYDRDGKLIAANRVKPQ